MPENVGHGEGCKPELAGLDNDRKPVVIPCVEGLVLVIEELKLGSAPSIPLGLDLNVDVVLDEVSLVRGTSTPF